MDTLEAIRLALSSIAHNKVRSGLTMLGVIIGVFAVVTLVSLGHGAQLYVQGQFAAMGTNLILVTPGKQETKGAGPIIGAANVHKLTLADARAMRRRLRSVAGVAPIIFGLGAVRFENRTRHVMVVGTGHEFPYVRNLYVETGVFFGAKDVDASRRVACIGQKVRAELFRGTNPLGKTISVMGMPFRVIGVMQHRGVSLGVDLDDIVFVPVTAAIRLFGTDALQEIIVKARRDPQETVRDISRLIRARHHGQDDVTMVTQDQMLSALNDILDILTYTLAGIAAISLIVGGIGIMNIMLVSVRERIKEIGIRKAVGARRRDILYQFLVEAVVLSVVGGALGIAFSVVTQLVITRVVPELPFALTPWAIALALTFSIATGIFFGVYPAMKAASVHPMEALRYE